MSTVDETEKVRSVKTGEMVVVGSRMLDACRSGG